MLHIRMNCADTCIYTPIATRCVASSDAVAPLTPPNSIISCADFAMATEWPRRASGGVLRGLSTWLLHLTWQACDKLRVFCVLP